MYLKRSWSLSSPNQTHRLLMGLISGVWGGIQGCRKSKYKILEIDSRLWELTVSTPLTSRHQKLFFSSSWCLPSPSSHTCFPLSSIRIPHCWSCHGISIDLYAILFFLVPSTYGYQIRPLKHYLTYVSLKGSMVPSCLYWAFKSPR